MLSWIPIIGPVIDGIVSIWKGYQNVDVAKYTIDGKIDIAAFQAASANIAATKDDIGIRLLRDLALTPACIWIALIGWDTIFAINHPHWMFHVEKFPDSVSYYPMMALGFLLGNIGINRLIK